MSVVGIDLGTTNTVAACVRSGKVHVLADEQGTRLLPSVVSFHPNGEVLVGAAAKARRVIDAKNTVYSHKRLIGRSWGSPEIGQAKQRFAFELKEGPGQGPLVHARGQDYTLPEISAFVLKRARQIAEMALGTPVERAVITVPAHFNELQRASTKVAGRVSGLEVLRILNEPTAAALAYGLGRTGSERVAVYDFGGGTFDCTLLDLNGNVFEVLATAGDSFLGGDDVDGMIAERMAETFLKLHRYDPRSDMQMLERLRSSAEEVKIALSTAEAHTVVLKEFGFGSGGANVTFNFTMSRGDLEAMMAPLLERTFKVTQDALSLARLTPTGFDKVILVGGSTRIPIVRKRVEAFFGAPPMDRVNPDEVVAIGAAIQAAALTEGTRKRNIPAPPPVPAGHARTMPGLPADTTEATFTSELDSSKLKPAFGSEPPSFGFGTRSSNPPAIAGDPRKITNPGLAPTTQQMGARPPAHLQTTQPMAQMPQSGSDEDPSIASFPDLAVPTPHEWFPSSGATQVKGPATSERSFGGNTITKTGVESPTLTAAADKPRPAAGAGRQVEFGAIDEPPSLYSTPSASVPSFPSLSSQNKGVPSPLGDTLASPATEPLTADAFGALRDLSLVSTSGVSSPGAPTQEDGPFGHLPDLSLVSSTGATGTAPNEAIAQARQRAVEGGLFSASPAGPAALQSADDSADLPALVRDADLPSLPARKKPEIRKTAPGMSAAGMTPAGGSSMLGKPPPPVAPQPFGPMEKIDDEPPSHTLSMQGRPHRPAVSTARAPGGVKPPPAPPSSSPMPARQPLDRTLPLAGAPQPRTPTSQPQMTAARPQPTSQPQIPQGRPAESRPQVPVARPAPTHATTQPLAATTPTSPPPVLEPPYNAPQRAGAAYDARGSAPPPAAHAGYGSAPPLGQPPVLPPTATAPFGAVQPNAFGSAPAGIFGSVPPGGHNVHNVPTAPPPPGPPPPAQQMTTPMAAQPVFGAPYPSAPPPALDHGGETAPHPAIPAQAVRYASPVLVDVTPRALVVETAGGYTDTIIPRNAKIPCERTRRFATGRDMQTSVRVRVGQGEHQHFPQNTYLGEVELSGLRPAARGEVVVAVTFEVDADGTLRVRARDVQTGQEARATLQLVGVADESSVVMMINRFANQPVVGGPTH